MGYNVKLILDHIEYSCDEIKNLKEKKITIEHLNG
jgi:hypothetical protein